MNRGTTLIPRHHSSYYGVSISKPGLGFGGKRQSSLYLSVGLQLVRNAVAPSTLRAYQGYFGSWVEFRLNVVCEPVFLEATENPVVNVRSLLEYTVYAVATKKLQAQTVESHLSAIKFFHRSSRGFELNTAHPLLRNALKGSARSLSRDRNRECEGRCRGPCCSPESIWRRRGGLVGAFCGLLWGRNFFFNAGGRDVCRN